MDASISGCGDFLHLLFIFFFQILSCCSVAFGPLLRPFSGLDADKDNEKESGNWRLVLFRFRFADFGDLLISIRYNTREKVNFYFTSVHPTSVRVRHFFIAIRTNETRVSFSSRFESEMGIIIRVIVSVARFN